jgi:hypothetical protein
VRVTAGPGSGTGTVVAARSRLQQPDDSFADDCPASGKDVTGLSKRPLGLGSSVGGSSWNACIFTTRGTSPPLP